MEGKNLNFLENNNNNNNTLKIDNNVKQNNIEEDKKIFLAKELEVSCLNLNNNPQYDNKSKFYKDIKKIELNAKKINENSSINFAFVKNQFLDVENKLNNLVVQFKNAFKSNNDETNKIIDSKLAQNFEEVKIFMEESFKNVAKKFNEIDEALKVINNNCNEVNNRMEEFYNKINTIEISQKIGNKEVENVKEINKLYTEENLNNKIETYFSRYHAIVEEKIKKNDEDLKNYIDVKNRELNNNFNVVCNKFNEYLNNNNKFAIENINLNNNINDYNEEDDNLIDESMKKNVNLKGREEINEEKNIANLYVLKLNEEYKAIKFVKIANVEKKIPEEYKIVFKKLLSDNNDIIFEVIKNLDKVKLVDFMKEKLKKLKKKSKKKNKNNGRDDDYYYIINITDSQIQFIKKVNKRFERFNNRFFFTKSDERDKIFITYTKIKKNNKKPKFYNNYPRKKGYYNNNNKNNFNNKFKANNNNNMMKNFFGLINLMSTFNQLNNKNNKYSSNYNKKRKFKNNKKFNNNNKRKSFFINGFSQGYILGYKTLFSK